MQICKDGTISTKASVVALGMFDGVHFGHQVLLKKAKHLADEAGVPLVVQTFADHPLSLLAPEKCPTALTTFEERNNAMAQCGVDILFAPPFTAAMRDMPPEDFVGHLVQRWHPTAVVVGFNHTFGSKGAGNPALLAALGDALGFETHVVPEIRIAKETVSATRIRSFISNGLIDMAHIFLGRPYRQRVTLQKDGARWAIKPVHLDKQMPSEGVYRTLIGNEQRRYPMKIVVTAQGQMLGYMAADVQLPQQADVDWLIERQA